MRQKFKAKPGNCFSTTVQRTKAYVPFMLSGTLLPLAFAPFHMPGFAFLSIAFLFSLLQTRMSLSAFFSGFCFGLGYFGVGVSWVFVSIHDYGHLNPVISALITLVFLGYVSLFPAGAAYLFRQLNTKPFSMRSALLFATLWIAGEWARSELFTGFPWLLVGYSQMDTPLRYLLPVIGLYGVGFITAFAGALTVLTVRQHDSLKRLYGILALVLILLLPISLKTASWAEAAGKPLTVGIVQANLSMRDKWDESLFWQLVLHYQQQVEKLLGVQMIVLPESAFPLPSSYLTDVFQSLANQAKSKGSAILLGIPEQSLEHSDKFYNALIALGKGKGSYFKKHLVPFGEYTPGFFARLMHLLSIPDADLISGKASQKLIRVHKHPVASLICYELAYGELLRQQLPKAQWLVSISDDGWFGHSLALYQHLQMAQVRSLQVARYQVVANNDGLSSVIRANGKIAAELPAYTEGTLTASVTPMQGATPWVVYGDYPVLLFVALILVFACLCRQKTEKETKSSLADNSKRRYP